VNFSDLDALIFAFLISYIRSGRIMDRSFMPAGSGGSADRWALEQVAPRCSEGRLRSCGLTAYACFSGESPRFATTWTGASCSRLTLCAMGFRRTTAPRPQPVPDESCRDVTHALPCSLSHWWGLSQVPVLTEPSWRGGPPHFLIWPAKLGSGGAPKCRCADPELGRRARARGLAEP